MSRHPNSNGHVTSAATSTIDHAPTTSGPALLAGPPPAPPVGPVASPPSPLIALVQATTQALDDLEAKLGLDYVVPPNDKNQIHAMKRVSVDALHLAADLAEQYPEHFPSFVGLGDAASYVEAMTPLAARCAALASHVEKSVDKRRAPAAVKTLALYAIVKSLGRIVDNEAMREKVDALKAAIVPPRKNPRPRQTKQETAVKSAAKSRAHRVKKALEVLAKDGPGPTAPAPPATAGGTGPHSGS